MQSVMPSPAPWRGRIVVLAGIVLVGLNLRIAVAAVSPIIEVVRQDFALTDTQVGLLGTVPVASFALFGSLATPVARRLGLEPTMILALLLSMTGGPPAGAGRQRTGVHRMVGDRARRPGDGQRAAPAAGQAVLPRPHRHRHRVVLGGDVRERGGAAAGRAARGAGRRVALVGRDVGDPRVRGRRAVGGRDRRSPSRLARTCETSCDERRGATDRRPSSGRVRRRAGSCGARGWPGRWCSRSSPTPPARTCCSRGCRRSSPTPAWAPTSGGGGWRSSRSSGCPRRSSPRS